MNDNRTIISDFEANKLIAEKMIETIKQGNYGEWIKNWAPETNLNKLYYAVKNGEAAALIYTAENITIFHSFGFPVEIKPGFYLTFKQIKRKKLSLKKGAKGIPLYLHHYYYKHFKKEQLEFLEANYSEDLARIKSDPTHKFTAEIDDRQYDVVWDYFKHKIAYTQTSYVLTYFFNNEDLKEPVDVKALWEVGEEQTIDESEQFKRAEEVKQDYAERTNLTIVNEFQNRAFYRPSDHLVMLPLIEQFNNGNNYYQAMFHELAHSTGCAKLLNRSTLANSYSGFRRTKEYNKEELIAELSSLFTLNSLGLLNEEIFKNSTAYIYSWGESLAKGIEHNIINTVWHSQRATNLILNNK